MSNEVKAIEVAKSQPLQVFGQDEQISGLVRRLRFMMPGAADAPDLIVWKAAQIATMHHLDPFTGDIYIYPMKGTYIVDTGVAAWRRAAQRQAKYTTVKRPMATEEIHVYLTGGYKPGDVGVECTLYRLDVAKECQSLGIPYEPIVTRGFFRDKDTIPNTETAISVAERRAEKKALRVAFSLDFPDEMRVDARHDYQVAEVTRLVANEEQHRLPATRPVDAAEMADFLDDSYPVSPIPPEEPEDAIFTEPKISDKDRLTSEVNRLGNQLYGANWRDFKSAEFANWVSGKNTDDLKRLGVTELERIAEQLRTKVAATGGKQP